VAIDGFLRPVPSDADLDDGRLYDPTVADGAAATDDPPIRGASLFLAVVVASWASSPGLPARAQPVAAISDVVVEVVDQTTPARLDTILSTWQPTWWPTQRRGPFTISIDDPPLFRQFVPIALPEPLPTQRRRYVPIDSVDDPPLIRGFVPFHVSDPLPTQGRRYVPLDSVDEPPPFRAFVPFPIPDPAPTQRRTSLIQPEIPAVVDDPPVAGAVARVRHAIRAKWDIPPEPVQRYARYGEGYIFPYTQYLGLKTFYASAVVDLCLVAEADGATAMGGIPKIKKSSALFAIYLVDITDPYASHVRINTTAGVKAIRLWTSGSGAEVANNLLDGTQHLDTLAGTVARGDLIVGNSTPKWARLALGARGKITASDGSDVAWKRPAFISAARPTIVMSYWGQGFTVNNGGAGRTAGGGTEAAASDTKRYSDKFSQAVNTGNTGSSWDDVVRADMNPAMWADCKIVSASKMILQIGFSDSGLIGGGFGSVHHALVTYREGTDTNFQLMTDNASGTPNFADTGIAKDANWHDFLVYTDDAGTTWKCEIDGVQVATTTTKCPTVTQAMRPTLGYCCAAVGSTGNETRHSYCVVQTGIPTDIAPISNP